MQSRVSDVPVGDLVPIVFVVVIIIVVVIAIAARRFQECSFVLCTRVGRWWCWG